MKCERCGMKEATTRVYRSNNGEQSLMYLCSDCAEAMHLNVGGMDLIQKLFGGSPMGLFSDLSGFIDAPTSKQTVCPECKTTSEEFLRTGFVGCPNCYKVFEPLVLQAVKQFQQSDTHIGKSPTAKTETGISEEEKLREEVRTAIANRQYALAGELSKKLDELTGKNGSGV